MKYTVLLDKLSRVTSSQRFIPEIDGLRFIAIATVVLFHLRTSILRFGGFQEKLYRDDTFFTFLSKGGLGVNLFFTISGFILALPFIRSALYEQQPVNLRKYFLRRITRLEPPYIIIMTVFFLIQSIISLNFNALFPHYVASLLYVHYFIYGIWSTINPVAWSLETEVQFYIVAPLLAFVYYIKNTLIRFALYATFLLSHIYIIFTYESDLLELHLGKSIVYYFSNFFLGFVIADLFLFFQWNRGKRNVLFDVVGVFGFILMFYSYFPYRWSDFPIFLASTALVFISAFKGRILNSLLTNKVITTIGGMCYTIYLIHYIFIFFVMQLAGNTVASITANFYVAFSISFLMLIPPLLVVSALVFYFIEKPFMYPDWYNRFRVKY